MTEKEMIDAACYAIRRNLDCDALRYSDEMYGKEKHTSEVWEYVTEAREIGLTAFREMYQEFNPNI